MAIVTEDRTPSMEAQFPATPEATEGQMNTTATIAEMEQNAADGDFIEQLWQELLDKDDRTSPAEYPDMALITFDEFAATVLNARARSAHADIEAGDGPVSAHLVIATKAMWKARSLIDEAMGDTDPNDENDPLLKACQALSKALNKIGAKP